MKQIFVANPKGGCGKTTIATQLAAYYANAGQRVLLIDHDAQKSSSDWQAGRPRSCSHIEVSVAKVDGNVDFGAADFVVHDMPAAWSLEHVADTIHSGDCVLVPVLPSPTDIKACLRFLMALHRSGLLEQGSIQLGLIANRSRAHTRYFRVLMAFLERIGLPLVGSLRDTQNYVRAMDEGLTIFDLPPSRVNQDLEQWQPIIGWLESA